MATSLPHPPIRTGLQHGSQRWSLPTADGHEPEPFVVLADTLGGGLAVPAASARAAQQTARHLTEHAGHIQATWQARAHVAPDPVVVFGCGGPPRGEHLFDQETHAFLLTPGRPPPSIWLSLCGDHIDNSMFEILDVGMGLPCPRCHQRWVAHYSQDTDPARHRITAPPTSPPSRRPSLRSGREQTVPGHCP